MAYDSLTTNQLAAQTRDYMNQCENAMQAAMRATPPGKARDSMNKAENAVQAAMRRTDELIVRVAKCDCDLHTTPTPAPTPTPTPTPAPTPPHDHSTAPLGQWVKASSILPIPSNFNVSDWLSPADIPPLEPNMGAMRMGANMSHLSYDDPVVWPGHPGAAHLHHFFGNRGANAHSTYESLRTTGDTTTDSDMVNRSAYWIPALLDGKGNVVVPGFVTIYYKRLPLTYPNPPGKLVDLPRGLRMVFGNNFNADPIPEDSHGRAPVNFGLLRNNVWVVQSLFLDEVAAQAQVGDEVFATISGPDCLLDDIHVDSPNHRAHVNYGYWQKGGGGFIHPVGFSNHMPQVTLRFNYPVRAGDDPKLWAYSSDISAAKRPGETLHADYMEAWDDGVRDMWHRNNMDKGLDGVSSNFGGGFGGKRWAGFSFDPQPHLIPVPPHP